MNSSVKENIKKIYKEYAKEFDEKIASLDIYNNSYNTLLNKIQDNATILDLACGPGNVSYYLLKHKSGLKITGVDISEEMIDLAKSRIEGGNFLVGDICGVEFNVKYDCIICAFAIPYLNLHETAHVIKIISSSLNGNGHFYMSFMEGQQKGYTKQSFTENDKLYVYHHSAEAVLELLGQQSLSVTSKFEIDYPEKDGTITKEIIYIGNLSHSKANSVDAKSCFHY